MLKQPALGVFGNFPGAGFRKPCIGRGAGAESAVFPEKPSIPLRLT